VLGVQKPSVILIQKWISLWHFKKWNNSYEMDLCRESKWGHGAFKLHNKK